MVDFPPAAYAALRDAAAGPKAPRPADTNPRDRLDSALERLQQAESILQAKELELEIERRAPDTSILDLHHVQQFSLENRAKARLDAAIENVTIARRRAEACRETVERCRAELPKKDDVNVPPNEADGEWLHPPLSLTDIASAANLRDGKAAKVFFADTGIIRKSRQRYTVRLNRINPAIRKRLEDKAHCKN